MALRLPHVVVGVLLLMHTGICAIIEEDTGTVLFNNVELPTRWCSTFSPRRRQTIGVVSAEQFNDLCRVEDPMGWKRPDWPDTLVLPHSTGGMVGEGPFCEGKLGTFAQGIYWKYWCNLSKTLIFLQRKEGIATYMRNARQHEDPSPDCRVVNAGLNLSMLEYMRNTNKTLRVTVEIDEDQWVDFDHWGFQLTYRGVFPCLYLFLLIQALRYGSSVVIAPTNLQKLSLAILSFEVPVLCILCASGFIYGSHGISPIPYDWMVFTYTEFFGPSCAADIILTIMYKESALRVQAVYSKPQRKKKISLMIIVCLCLGALVATVLMFIISYRAPPQKVQGVLSNFVVPAYLTVVQGVLTSYLFYCTIEMRRFLSKATTLVSDDMKAICEKVERDLCTCVNISIVSSVVNMATFTMFDTPFFKGNAKIHGLLLICFKFSRVGNTWARLQAVRVVIGDNKIRVSGATTVLKLVKQKTGLGKPSTISTEVCPSVLSATTALESTLPATTTTETVTAIQKF